MSKFRIMLLSTVAVGMVAMIDSPASAGEVEKSLSIGGRVNRAVVVSDNGENTTISQTDPTAVSGSRLTIKGSAKSEAMTISATTELGIQANGSAGSHSSGGTSINIRHSYVSVNNNMGTLSVGHTWEADALTLSNSLSGTGNAGFYDGSILAGEEIRVKSDTGTASSSKTVGGVVNGHGAGRDSVIKYTTPNMSGFSANLGYGHNSHGAAQLTYGGDFDGTKVQAQASWGSRADSATVSSETSASLAVALAGGLYGTVAYSKQDLDSAVSSTSGRKDPDFWGASLGYKMGASAVTAFYSAQDDLSANGDDAKTMGLVVEHQLSDYGTSVYGGIQNVDYDTTAADYDDLTGGWVGIRVNF